MYCYNDSVETFAFLMYCCDVHVETLAFLMYSCDVHVETLAFLMYCCDVRVETLALQFQTSKLEKFLICQISQNLELHDQNIFLLLKLSPTCFEVLVTETNYLALI